MTDHLGVGLEKAWRLRRILNIKVVGFNRVPVLVLRPLFLLLFLPPYLVFSIHTYMVVLWRLFPSFVLRHECFLNINGVRAGMITGGVFEFLLTELGRLVLVGISLEGVDVVVGKHE